MLSMEVSLAFLHFMSIGSKLSPSHFTDETYTKFLCRIRFEMLDVNECEKMWCYSCKSFKDNSRNLLRAQYEHKTERIQNLRYKQDLDKSQKEEGNFLSSSGWRKHTRIMKSSGIQRQKETRKSLQRR